ncbi:MAG: hypothetical protein HYZ51_05105 [Candidatus Doudnabacteria bacterium]|nr:hypothetical protein [Candidatus Doudnabacteria bacterium]
MQTQEIDKIRQLISTSSLLSQGEKEEWLSLAGIMNDKQLWELKSILLQNMEHGTWNMKQKTSPPPNLSPQGGGIKMGIPPLTHIMNLPKAGTVVFPKSVSSFKFQVSKTEEQAGKQAGFWKKVKDILAEKELLPGHPEAVKELELPAPKQYQAPGPKHPEIGIPSATPLTRGGKLETRPLLVPRPVVANSDKVSKPPPLPPLAARPVYNAYVKEPAPAESPAIFKAVKNIPEGDSLFVPGLQDTRILMQAKLSEKHENPKTPPVSHPEPMKPELVARPANQQSIPINSLETASQINKADLSKDIVKGLKNLSSRFGYHKVEMALEKSPLFKLYINTGLRALSGKGSLDDSRAGEQLNREEFEKFVDVLRSIKN